MGVGLLAREPAHLLDGASHHRRLRVSPRTDAEHRDHNLAKLDELDRCAAEAGCSRVALCLAWLCARGPHVIPLPGTRRVEHLEENCAAAVRPLPVEVLALVDELFPAGTFHGSRKPSAALQLSLP
jgi:aryl-alcohol dehydrogenase-like predicted oxidoreductase